MASDRGTSFPVAGAAVVALFLSTAFLAPRGFDLLRQSEDDAGRQVQLSKPVVEARLWEDPLEAQRRHREKLKELCPEPPPDIYAFRGGVNGGSARSALRGRSAGQRRGIPGPVQGRPSDPHRSHASGRHIRRQRGSKAAYPLRPARRPERRRLRPRRQRTHEPAAGAALPFLQRLPDGQGRDQGQGQGQADGQAGGIGDSRCGGAAGRHRRRPWRGAAGVPGHRRQAPRIGCDGNRL